MLAAVPRQADLPGVFADASRPTFESAESTSGILWPARLVQRFLSCISVELSLRFNSCLLWIFVRIVLRCSFGKH